MKIKKVNISRIWIQIICMIGQYHCANQWMNFSGYREIESFNGCRLPNLSNYGDILEIG